MKKLLNFSLALFLVAGVFVLTKPGIAQAANYEYCPVSTQLSGWWGAIAPTNRLCSLDYYTWNTQSLGGEESWFKSNPTYTSCHKGTPPFGPTYYSNLGTGVNIPSPDGLQTSSAHYYRWGPSSWGLIGTVNQYNTFGWANLATTSWFYLDRLKLSDWTNDATKYSKHVDLDRFRFTNCP